MLQIFYDFGFAEPKRNRILNSKKIVFNFYDVTRIRFRFRKGVGFFIFKFISLNILLSISFSRKRHAFLRRFDEKKIFGKNRREQEGNCPRIYGFSVPFGTERRGAGDPISPAECVDPRRLFGATTALLVPGRLRRRMSLGEKMFAKKFAEKLQKKC